MKKVYVFRHGKQEDLGRGYTSWSPDALLTEEGKVMMMEVARRHSGNLFKVFATSPLIRAQQSLYAMIVELCDLSKYPQILDEVIITNGLKTAQPEVWYTEDLNATITTIYKKDPKAAEKEGEHILRGIKSVADCILAKNGNALCVSHGGPLDMALVCAKDVLGVDAFDSIHDLGKGEGAVFYYEGKVLKKVEELRHPQS